MIISPINPPFPFFAAQSGAPLEAGYIYIGEAGFEARSQPKASFWDANGSIPTGTAAGNPIRTMGGLPVFAGSPANIHVSGDYSITVLNKDRALVYSATSSGDAFAGYIKPFDTVSALRSDTDMGYSAPSLSVMTAGDYVAAGDFRYIVSASSASDQHITTAGGVKLYVDTSNALALHIGAFGDIGGANASPAVQAMIDELGFFVLPPGEFNCQDPIVLPGSLTAGQLGLDVTSFGAGPRRSRLKAVGMAGEVLMTGTPSAIMRHNLRDLGLVGDADSALDLTGVGSLYQSDFSRVHFESIAGSAFKTGESFSVSMDRCDFWSDNGHGLEIKGGNSTVLTNCYAHKCGAGKAGYRIKQQAILIGCNGIDVVGGTHRWGTFGDAGVFFRIKILGGNIEDFGAIGLELLSTGWLSMEDVPFQASSTGTFETYIKATSGAGNGLMIDVGHGVSALSKGATRTGTSNIVTVNGARVSSRNNNPTVGGAAYFPDYAVGATLYEAPVTDTRTDEFAKSSAHFTRINGDRILGYFRPQREAMTANATTYVVTSKNLIETANTVATSLQTMTGGEDGQELTLLIRDANTTLKHNTGGAGRMVLKTGADIVATSGQVFKFVQNSSIWQQI